MNGHHIFRRNMSLMYKIDLFSSSNLTISAVFEALSHYFRFWRSYWIFVENGHFTDILTSTTHYIYVYFHVKEEKCTNIKLIVSTFASLPVLVAILNFFSILTVFFNGFCSRNVAMTLILVLRRSKPIR